MFGSPILMPGRAGTDGKRTLSKKERISEIARSIE
jgi:hypothetical protein